MNDLSTIKTQFPLLNNHPELVYLDSAATTQKPKVVIEAITKFYTEENANVHRGIYALSERVTEKYESCRKKIAEFLGVNSREIVFTSGTTAAANMVAYGLHSLLSPGDIVMSSKTEHHSNLLPFRRLAESTKAQLVLLDSKADGKFDYSSMEDKVTSLGLPKIMVISAGGNVLGYNTDINHIVKTIRLKSPETIIVADLAQAVGHRPLNLKQLDIDFAYFSGHKLFAGTGIGVLWGKLDLLEKLEPWLVGGGAVNYVNEEEISYRSVPQKLEAGTPDIAGVLSLGAAIDFINEIGLKAIESYLASLSEYAYNKLEEVKFIEIYGPESGASQNLAELISFNLKGLHPHDVAQLLAEDNIAVRAGQHCASILHNQVIKQPGSVRASWHIYNNRNDIDRLTESLNRCYKFYNV